MFGKSELSEPDSSARMFMLSLSVSYQTGSGATGSDHRTRWRAWRPRQLLWRFV